MQDTPWPSSLLRNVAVRSPWRLVGVVAVLLPLLGGATALLGGCGASNGQVSTGSTVVSRAQGRATVSIVWPAVHPTSRLIPAAANSISVRLTSTDGKTLFGSALLVRPSGGGAASASFDRISVGTVLVTATAYPNADGTGVAQATAQTTTTVVQSQTSAVSLTLASTIDSVVVTPASPNLVAGQTTTLIATPMDASGNVVLIGPSTLQWASSSASVATVDVSGVVTAVGAGTATITATETESGISGTTTVSVTAAPTPTPSPTPTPTPSPAGLIYEYLNYTPGQNLTGLNGASGWNDAWQSHGPGSPSVIVSGSISYLNLKTSGNAYETTSDAPIGDNRDFNTFGTPGQVVYASMLMRPLDPMNAGSPDTYFEWSVGNVAIGRSGTDSHICLEQAGNGGGGVVPTSIVAQQNTTYFMVVRVTFGTASSTVDLWVNPTPGQPLPAKPDATRVGSFTTMSALGTGASIRCLFDEYRVGNTFADVAPTQ